MEKRLDCQIYQDCEIQNTNHTHCGNNDECFNVLEKKEIFEVNSDFCSEECMFRYKELN